MNSIGQWWPSDKWFSPVLQIFLQTTGIALGLAVFTNLWTSLGSIGYGCQRHRVLHHWVSRLPVHVHTNCASQVCWSRRFWQGAYDKTPSWTGVCHGFIPWLPKSHTLNNPIVSKWNGIISKRIQSHPNNSRYTKYLYLSYDIICIKIYYIYI